MKSTLVQGPRYLVTESIVVHNQSTWFVVAVMTPMGSVKKKASPHASKNAHHGN